MPWAKNFIRSCGISDSWQVAAAVSTVIHFLGNPYDILGLFRVHSISFRMLVADLKE